MKYKIGDAVSINNTDWIISEHRMGRGREYKYTLSYEDMDGNYVTMSLNERAMDGILLGKELGSES